MNILHYTKFLIWWLKWDVIQNVMIDSFFWLYKKNSHGCPNLNFHEPSSISESFQSIGDRRGGKRGTIPSMWLQRWKNNRSNCIHYDDLVCHPMTILSILTLSCPVTEWSLTHSEEVPWTLHWKVPRVVHVVRHTRQHLACRVRRISPRQSDARDYFVNQIGAI